MQKIVEKSDTVTEELQEQLRIAEEEFNAKMARKDELLKKSIIKIKELQAELTNLKQTATQPVQPEPEQV